MVERNIKISDLATRVRHLGVVVDDIETSVSTYKKIYDIDDGDITIIPPLHTEAPDTRYAFLKFGGMEFELIQCISENFKNLLGNPPAGINHIAYIVKDLEKAVARMKENGVRLGHVTKDGILDMKRSKVAYFNVEDTDGLLVEFVEPIED
jgi:catechol 2,3-dioxygenase-like lactoylglutathione lyase family enzyme